MEGTPQAARCCRVKVLQPGSAGQNSSMDKLILIGGGGHCAACLDVLKQEKRFAVAAVVDRPEKLGETVCGLAITATDDDLPELIGLHKNVLISIGQIKTAEPRQRAYDHACALGAELPAIISPFSIVSDCAELGAGTIIMHQALLNSRVRIGQNTIINTRALIEHDSIVGNHCHISTAAVLNGGCRVDDGCFVGSSAVLREGVRLGSGCVIGCGAVVLADVPENSTVYGLWKG